MAAGSIMTRVKLLYLGCWRCALLITCAVMAGLPPAIAQSPSEAGECHNLSRDRALEVLPNELDIQDPDDIVFYIDTPEQRMIMNQARQSDVALQLAVADALYRDVLGLTPPLRMPRYQRANFIMVILRADQTRGGQAYDEVVNSNASPSCHIRMALGGGVNAAQNVTPAHELFHLYQNAHMMFKQGWVHEGLARWVESLLRGDIQKGEPLPINNEALTLMMQESYDAASFWQRLFYLLDSEGSISIPDILKEKRYQDGSQVVNATYLYGSEFLPLLFSSFDETGKVLANQEQWPVYGWAEAEQRNLCHNEVILSAVYQAVLDYMPLAEQPEELRAFMHLLEPLIDR